VSRRFAAIAALLALVAGRFARTSSTARVATVTPARLVMSVKLCELLDLGCRGNWATLDQSVARPAPTMLLSSGGRL